ncbi:heterokaryon incompatibility protein-domain-containing protein [Fusarium tricinctum]|uniref:Heterokaryon incompatibility protein-domain-containing protein n=1 Tax=Fusarium tricinctum TaxID=61284 RepID=A0A8K0SAS4_9HYPO|nr:heterokaryon incompatibility protein-domain-containing protein [Fusarium tricinctum]
MSAIFYITTTRFSSCISFSYSFTFDPNSVMSLLQQQRNNGAEPGETSYDINNLCATCSSAFLKALDSYNTWKRMFCECDESYVLVCDRLAQSSVKHHESFHGLRQAARAGCHLCNLIEIYCTISPIDPDLPVMLKVDIRNTGNRNYSFDASVDKERTEVWLGLKDTKYASSQIAGTYYHPAGGIPEAIFDMIGDWLHECQGEHQACREKFTKHIPTRLVDVGTADSSTVHLIETGTGFHAPYLTLSHCWGRNANIIRRTAGGNLEIPLKQLPRTFKDAITVTRRLGFTYLWIDSLCIIQGDNTDWERESANMASIYSEGVLNLAASYSSDSHGGLLLERDQHHVTSCSWKQQTDPVSSRNPGGGWMQSGHVCWTFDPQSEFGKLGLGRPLPLISRGWVLQENVLSPRTVHFLPGEIIWECRELSAKESTYCRPNPPAEQPQQFRGKVTSSPETVPVIQNGPKNFLRFDPDNSGGQQTTSEQKGGVKSNLNPRGQFYNQWYDMVMQYSQKDLTRSEDRLPAIWALTQKFQETTRDEYFSGIWKEDILNGLLFKRFQPRPGCHARQTRCGPSWSWASTECRVEFERPNLPPSSSSVEMDQIPDACLQSFVIDPTEPRALSMGRTRQAELEIRTLAKELVGYRYDWNPSPGKKVAKAMGITGLWAKHSIDSRTWRRYEELSREYDGQRYWESIWSSSSKEDWIRERAPRQDHRFTSSMRPPDCYFGWAGAKFIEEARWDERRKAGQSRGQDKILSCVSFDLEFDTIELANAYNGKPVLCLHLKGTSGLLAELDTSSQMYRRVGIYRQTGGWDKLNTWKLKTVVLI